MGIQTNDTEHSNLTLSFYGKYFEYEENVIPEDIHIINLNFAYYNVQEAHSFFNFNEGQIIDFKGYSITDNFKFYI